MASGGGEMTRSFFKGLTIRAVICVILSMTFLLSCLWYTRSVNRSKEQDAYREEYGTLLMAERYRALNTDVLKNHKDIKSVYSAYDETGKLIGYIVDVETEVSSGKIHAQMSISENGENLMNIRVVQDDPEYLTYTEDEMNELRLQLKGARIPVAVRQDVAIDTPYQVDYDPLLGLHDGTFYARSKEAAKDGYVDYVEIVVKGGRIVNCSWDAEDESTHKTRSEDSISGDYKTSGEIWAEQAYRVAKQMVLVQDPVKLAMKSDGKTEIIDGVTMDISMFVSLVDQCIENSRNSYSKEQYMHDHSDDKKSEGDDKKKDNEKDETTNENEELTPTPAPQFNPSQDLSPTPMPTRAPSQIGVIGGEDGVVASGDENVLSDSVDGIPMNEIRTRIDGLSDDKSRSAALLTAVNQAYKFIREYLNWVG